MESQIWTEDGSVDVTRNVGVSSGLSGQVPAGTVHSHDRCATNNDVCAGSNLRIVHYRYVPLITEKDKNSCILLQTPEYIFQKRSQTKQSTISTEENQ